MGKVVASKSESQLYTSFAVIPLTASWFIAVTLTGPAGVRSTGGSEPTIAKILAVVAYEDRCWTDPTMSNDATPPTVVAATIGAAALPPGAHVVVMPEK